MTHQRRAPQRIVAGAALAVLLLVGACAGDTNVVSGADQNPSAPVATAIATTAPALAAAPAPSPVGLPTLIPLPTPTVSDQEPTSIVPVTPTVEASPAPTEVPGVPTPPTGTTTAVEGPPVTTAPTTVPSPSPAAITESQQVLVANGSEVYTLNCARCHGENGMGSAQYSAGLIGIGSQYSAQGMIAELTNGHPVTFGFADRLSPDEIASVVAYVKSAFP